MTSLITSLPALPGCPGHAPPPHHGHGHGAMGLSIGGLGVTISGVPPMYVNYGHGKHKKHKYKKYKVGAELGRVGVAGDTAEVLRCRAKPAVPR